MQCYGDIYWFILLVVPVVAVILVSEIVVARCSVGDHVGICLCSVLLVIRIIVLTLVVRVSYMCLIDFYFIFSIGDINVVDLVNFSVVYALFSNDPRFKIHCFLESCLQILW